MLGVWTGSSTLSLDYVKLEANFITPNHRSPLVQLDFCEPVDSAIANDSLIVAPGKQYKMLFGKFVSMLARTSQEFELECSTGGGLGFHPTRVSTCAKTLMIYLQSGQQMFNSLVDLLNTPLTAIRDN